jgi:DNA-binding TFAR19-related protein (PDSD5 family)
MNDDANEEIEIQRRIIALEEKVRPFLTKDALSRYGTIRIGHPDVAIQVLVILARAIDAGKIQSEINDEQFKAILQRIIPQKRDFKIIRK